MYHLLSKFNYKFSEKYPELRDRDSLKAIDRESLLFFAGNMHSQIGQDGILAEIFRRLKINYSYFVEFGGWDGIFMSNCRFLYEMGWSGCFIEGDIKKFNQLEANYRDTKNIICLNEMVGFSRDDNLAALIKKYELDHDLIDFVSIDVDGIDLDIFENLGFSPKVILIEGGFSLSPLIEKKQDTALISQNVQQSLSVICAEGKRLGYTPVCFCQDTYFVRNDLVGNLFKNYEPIDLYTQAYNFLPVNKKKELLNFRKNNTTIRQIEESNFGEFKLNPLSYL